MSQLAADVIGKAHPDLRRKTVPSTDVLNWHTHDLEVVLNGLFGLNESVDFETCSPRGLGAEGLPVQTILNAGIN